MGALGILPGVDRAQIEPAKIRDYLLSTSHPVGRFKAAFFATLGYSSPGWETLADDIRKLIVSQPATLGAECPYGQKYEVFGKITRPSGKQADLVTIWIVLESEGIPGL